MPGHAKAVTCILVVGYGPTLEQDDGAAALLRQLGAEVRAMDLWDDFTLALDRAQVLVRGIVFEAGDRPDLAVASLRAARREPRLKDVPALIQLPTRQVARLEPSRGFDDLICPPPSSSRAGGGAATKGALGQSTSTFAACARSWGTACPSRRCAGRGTSFG